jgi:hypothetical protein
MPSQCSNDLVQTNRKIDIKQAQVDQLKKKVDQCEDDLGVLNGLRIKLEGIVKEEKSRGYYGI